jgi:thymidine kinase
MFHGTRPGWVEVIAGVMFSGKSEELVRRVRRAVIAKKRVQVFKSHLDARYAGLYTVSTHDGGIVDAAPVDSAEAIVRALRPETEVVAVDEVQFLDDEIVTTANDLADRGVRVLLAGIDMDCRSGRCRRCSRSPTSSISSRRSAWSAAGPRPATSAS